MILENKHERISKNGDGLCRDLEMQHQVAANAHADQQAQLQQYDRAYAACLSGRGYTVK